MKTNNILLLGSVILPVFFFSCSKEGDQATDYSVRFNIVYPYPSTKVTATGFESGDTCGVYMTEYENGAASKLQVSGNVVNNAALVNSAGSWSLTPKAYWEPDKQYDVYAYYPYGNPESTDNFRFSVALDQSSDSAYTASDFLWASAMGVKYPDVVSLSFKHVLSKVVINLVKGDDYTGDLPDNAEVRLYSLYCDSEIDLSAGYASYYGTSPSDVIKARKDSDTTFSAIVIPQRMSSRMPLIEVLCDNVSYIVEDKMTFKSGMQHTINVVLSDNPEKVAIDIGGEIVGW